MAYILVDDDDLLRDSLQQMLKLDGHDVLEATSGEEALRLSEGDSRIDLMLTDILMPVMDGGRLIVEMRQRRPGDHRDVRRAPHADAAVQPRDGHAAGRELPVAEAVQAP
ncbi:MAG: response regulator [Comamonadaceae bacterium]|nr:response regulator [Comamonadaceae bacterium]